jgi:hypothetical protein
VFFSLALVAVTGESGVGDEDDKLSEDDEEIASTGSHYDSEQWKELEEIEGNVSDLLAPVSPEAAAFWATTFKEVKTPDSGTLCVLRH